MNNTRSIQMKKIVLENGELKTVPWEDHYKVEEKYTCSTCGKVFWDIPDMNRTLCCECFFEGLDEFDEEE